MRELLYKLQVWYIKNRFKYGRDYEFYLDLNDVEAYAVKILRKYNDTIVEFKNVTASEDGSISFDFVVVANPKLHNTESKAFKNFTSNVMRSIMFTAIDNFERNIDEYRATNPNQFDQERIVYEESDSVPETRVPERKSRKKAVRRNKELHPEV